MRCKVIILHNVWKTVVVDSRKITNWFPAGYDVNAGLAQGGMWRREFDESIPSIKSFTYYDIDIAKLNNQIIKNIRGLCDVSLSLDLQNRYVVVSRDEIVAEYDDSFDNPENNFAVYITLLSR